MKIKKLVCDRCGLEVSDPADIDQMVAGAEAWINSRKQAGEQPRGIFPCKNYVRCGGEMQIQK